MDLVKYLKEDVIFLDLPCKTMHDAVRYLSSKLSRYYKLSCEKEIADNIFEREKVKSTGLSRGLAVPHGRIGTLNDLYIAFGRSKEGIEWNSADKKPAHYIFLIAGPDSMVKEYLEILSQVSKTIQRQSIRSVIKDAGKPQEIIDIIKKSGVRKNKRQ